MSERKGDCYQVHGDGILKWGEGLLCHGTVWHSKIGWHGHAWIELNELVFDFANGNRGIVPKAFYYAVGRVKDVKKYTVDETAKMMQEKGTYGPWEGEYV